MSLAAVPDEPSVLNESEARAITSRIRQCVTVALVEIRKAFEGRAWEALGYSTWADYCSSEFGEHIQLPRDERQAAVAELREAGMSTRAIAAATGVHKDTVRNDLARGELSPPVRPAAGLNPSPALAGEPVPATVTGLDGKRYQTPVRPPVSAEDEMARARAEAELIVEAVAHTRAHFATVPGLGMVTFVDPAKVKPKQTPGYCYQCAGFEHVGFTKAGLWVWQMFPDAMPRPVPVDRIQPSLFEAVA